MRLGPSNSSPSACEKLPKRHTTKNFQALRGTRVVSQAIRAVFFRFRNSARARRKGGRGRKKYARLVLRAIRIARK